MAKRAPTSSQGHDNQNHNANEHEIHGLVCLFVSVIVSFFVQDSMRTNKEILMLVKSMNMIVIMQSMKLFICFSNCLFILNVYLFWFGRFNCLLACTSCSLLTISLVTFLRVLLSNKLFTENNLKQN